MLKALQRLRSRTSSPGADEGTRNGYSEEFYAAMSDGPDASSTAILKAAFDTRRPNSFVDCGCGTGKWVATALQLGVADSIGVDYVARNQLIIPEANYVERDLEKNKLDLGRRFDLAICLEVVEHLSHQRAPSFIQELCALSDVILFSAAMPFQGGTWHINEQWLEYWGILFRKEGYVPVDILRDRLWLETDVHWYYRQNVIYFCKEGVAQTAFPSWRAPGPALLSRIHPEMFMAQLSKFWPYMYGDAYYKEIHHYHLLARAWLAGDVSLPSSGCRAEAVVEDLGKLSLDKLDPARASMNNRSFLNHPLSVEKGGRHEVILRGA